MAHYKLKKVGYENGYSYYEDSKGLRYSAYTARSGTETLQTLAKLNWFGERDMPIFTKEYCEYQGYERKEFDTVEFI